MRDQNFGANPKLSGDNTLSEAVILMAGSGSRLRDQSEGKPKPLIRLLGRPLIAYLLEALAQGGIKTAFAIVGFERGALIDGVKPLVPASLDLQFIHNPNWEKQNGVSVLAAADYVRAPFLLTMSDHLFDQSIIDLLRYHADPNELNLAIDRKLGSIFDLDDAMKVRMEADRIVAIGKDLSDYDAIDTGLFVCPKEIFHYLERAKRNDDCSLADGVRLMAWDGKARGIDIGDAWWQDVDTPQMLQFAEKQIAEKIGRVTTNDKV